MSEVVIKGLRDKENFPGLEELITNLKHLFNIEGQLKVVIRDDYRSGPNAEVKDGNLIITRGLINILNADELEVFLAHEFSHLSNRDEQFLFSYILMPFAVLAIALFMIIAYTFPSLTITFPYVGIILFLCCLRLTRYILRKKETRSDMDAIFKTKKSNALKSALIKLFINKNRANLCFSQNVTQSYYGITDFLIGPAHPDNFERLRNIDTVYGRINIITPESIK
jgi:Zn-dependent protease with chaperone function